MRRSAGFTLIELMITVIVLSIVVTIAVPSFISLLQSNQLTGQVNQLVGALNAARTEAIKMNQHVVLCHSTDGLSCSAPSANGWQGWLIGLAPPRPQTGIVANSVMASGYRLSDKLILHTGNSISATNSEIRFSPQGLIRTTAGAPLNGVVRICLTGAKNNNARDVVIRSGGHIAINSQTSAACTAP